MFIGYARSNLSVEDLRQNILQYVKLNTTDEIEMFEVFMRQNFYVQGSYDKPNDFVNLEKEVRMIEGETKTANRLFYLALPPTVFETVTKLIHDHCMSKM